MGIFKTNIQNLNKRQPYSILKKNALDRFKLLFWILLYCKTFLLDELRLLAIPGSCTLTSILMTIVAVVSELPDCR